MEPTGSQNPVEITHAIGARDVVVTALAGSRPPHEYDYEVADRILAQLAAAELIVVGIKPTY